MYIKKQAASKSSLRIFLAADAVQHFAVLRHGLDQILLNIHHCKYLQNMG